ncbi:hypothetical protein BC834DRAFT_586654 [Gloeopeniophorella convolvens]|nr:hypothetical protein BC834DRAFT_586654 [Gloeopeniophorella convolvens]
MFETMGNSIRRVETYTVVDTHGAFDEIIVKILVVMLELLALLVVMLELLALATRDARIGRLRKMAKKAVGDKSVDDIMKRLDRLTLEESRMSAIQVLDIVHGLFLNMKTVMIGGEVAIDSLKDALVAMQKITLAVNKIARESESEAHKKWLSPYDPSYNQIMWQRKRDAGTSEWFIEGEYFRNWEETPNACLWIMGKPGSGKTILCSRIIDELESLRKMGLGVVAYFYYDFQNMATQNYRSLLCSLVHQLSV